MQKNPTHGFTVSTKSRPNFTINQISNIYISHKWGQLAPTLDHFYQTLKAVTCKCQLSSVDPLRGHTEAILAKIVRRRGSSGQTGSRNMAATHFLNSATPTSYSTPNTLGGLSRTVTELPLGAVTIAPLLRPPATRNILNPDGDIANSSAHCSKRRRAGVGVAQRARRRAWATLPDSGDRFGRRYGGQKPYFRFYRTGSSITRTDFGAWTDRRSITGDRAATQAEIRRKPSSRGRWRPNRK